MIYTLGGVRGRWVRVPPQAALFYPGFSTMVSEDWLTGPCNGIGHPESWQAFSCKLFLEVKVEDEFQECRQIISEIFEEYIVNTKQFKTQ